MSLVFSYTRSVDLYRSSAIVTFETEYVLADRDQLIKSLFEDKVRSVVGTIRFGDSIRDIVRRVWPDLNPEVNPVEFNSKVSALGSRSGIELVTHSNNERALTISFTAKDPDEAYRVVQATVDSLIDQTKSLTERRVANSESFLKREIEAYRAKLERMDQEIVRLENGLAPLMGDADQGARSTNSDGTQVLDPSAFRDQLKYRESLPQLEFDLKVAEKELARLVSSLESEDYLNEAQQLEGLLSVGDDDLLKELRSSIIAKEKDRHLLSSQGFLELHPKRKALDAEIRNLKKLEKERVAELGKEAGVQGTEIAKLKLERELRGKISAKTEEVTRLRDRIAVLKRYQQEVREQKDEIVSQIDVFASQRSQLDQLKQQKSITAEAYHTAVTELEQIRRQGRADRGDIGLRITIAEAPQVPKNPVPLAHMSTVLMGLAMSIAAGVGLVCIIDVLDTSVSSAAELREFSPVPVLGEIDRMVTEAVKKKERTRRYALAAFLVVMVLSSDIIVSRLIL
jgi:hypothetical protein